MRTTALALGLAVVLAFGCTDQTTTPTELSETVSAPVFNNGAVVFRGDIGCAVVDGNGDWFPQTFDLPCGTEVSTYSRNGNAKVTVQASGAPNPTGKTVHWGPYNPGRDWVASYPELDGPPYPCFMFGPDRTTELYTVNWKATVTPSGQGTLTCIYSKKWEFQWPD